VNMKLAASALAGRVTMNPMASTIAADNLEQRVHG